MGRSVVVRAMSRGSLLLASPWLCAVILLSGCPRYTATGAACDPQVLCPSELVCSRGGHCEASCAPAETACAGLCVAAGTCALSFERPGAPTAVVATAGVNEATIKWVVPVDGGTPITGFTVTASPGGAKASTTGAAVATITGLAAGGSYTFTVFATNSVGNGPTSAPSAPVTLPTVPGAPTEVVAMGSANEATVSWAAPSDGGSPIQWYTVTTSPGGTTVQTTTTTAIVSGLVGEQPYTFTVVATNSVGDGPPSAPTGPLTLPTAPAAPTNVSALAGINQATVTWTAADDGGSPITSYTVTTSPGGATATTNGATTAVITGLLSGGTYTFTVVATNALGDSPLSLPSEPITLPAVPNVPLNLAATAGMGRATLTWTPPADNGSPILDYTVTTSPGIGSVTVNATTVMITGLTFGELYTFAVYATNALGNGPAATTSLSIVVPEVPGAPTGVVAIAGVGQATVSWTAPGDNGSAITGYTVTASPGGATVTTQGATAVAVPGLGSGDTYTFTVFATNRVGNGPASAASPAITLPAVPGAPTDVVALAGALQATVSWTAPADGGDPITLYTVTATPGGTFATTTGATTVTITGLTSGQSYTFVVVATNAVGDGPPSQASVAITLPSVPGAPLNVFAGVGNQEAFLSWAPPPSDGGSAITSYTVVESPGGAQTTVSGALTATVTGLMNGVTYSFTVFATNAVGNGPSSAPAVGVPVAVPGAPTGVLASSGPDEAFVTWTAPLSSGGTPITGYTVLASPAGIMVTTTGATSATVTGLMNGQTYTFTVFATNAVGNGPPSAASAPLALPNVPAAPTAVVAVAGNVEATITWTAPADDGGSTITGYTVTVVETGATISTAGATTATVTGLLNGMSYTFTVFATSSAGNGPPSDPSAAVIPDTVPDAPTSVVAVGGDGQATVSWTAPFDEGSAITSYTVTIVQTGTVAGPFAGTSGIIGGLTNGTGYTFTVFATNAVGNGTSSAPSPLITPATTPGAPTAVTATAGTGDATVSWIAPANGGSVITRYTVTVVETGATVTTTGATSAVVSGLTGGQSYTFTVFATNRIGNGPPSSASTAVTIPNVPGAPGSVTAIAGIGQAVVSWSAPTTGGGTITGYTVSANPGGATVTNTGALTATITGLANGGTYTFTVFATNSAGNGTSTTSAPITLPNVPGAPTGVTATATAGQATVSWSAPASNGGSPITGYTVTSSPGSITVTTTGALTATLTGLVNGTAYSFAVFATNAVGNGPSSASGAVTPLSVPGPPTGVTATAGSLSATVTWTAPATTGGTPITSSTVTVVQTGAKVSVTGTSATIPHLADGTSYTFTVFATNSVGNGPASAASNAVTVIEIPNAGTSTLTASPATIMSDGTSATTLTATIEDASGNPLPNLTVSFTATGSANTFSATSAVTNANGQATSSLTSTKVQTETIEATVGAVVISASLEVTAPPSLRIGHAMTYDAGAGVSLLFGGSSGGNYQNDTWEWNGSLWTHLAPATSPSARVGSAMAYDAGRGVVVLFGGLGNNNDLNDTWEWNGSNWTKQSPATSPGARDTHAMVYDASRGVVVLFGGQNNGNYSNDTWEWNGTDWAKQSPGTSPATREGFGLAYGPAAGNAMLFGGFNGNYGNDTWEWNGSNWSKQSPGTEPVARANLAMTYDASEQVAVLFGGTNGNLLGDTWEWNGTTWTKQAPASSPPARSDHGGITYDSGRGVVVLFGGNGSNGGLNDTWEWNGTTWTERSPG